MLKFPSFVNHYNAEYKWLEIEIPKLAEFVEANEDHCFHLATIESIDEVVGIQVAIQELKQKFKCNVTDLYISTFWRNKKTLLVLVYGKRVE